MYILWIIYLGAIIIAFAGLLSNSNIFFYAGSIILFSATLVSFFIALSRYRNYTYKGNDNRINMFLMKNRGKGLEDIKEGDKTDNPD